MPLAGLPDLALLRPGRVHEAAGTARHTFAAALAGRLCGPVLWIAGRDGRGMLCPQGLAPFFEPSRLVLACPAGALALLQTAEAALRSGAACLVVAELAEAPDLTASRRLQLAAGAGGGRGLCLLPEAGLRANAAETRWICAPLPGGPARQRWELVKNKRGRLGCWEVAWESAGSPPSPDRHASDRHTPDRHAPDRHAPDRHAPDRHAPDRHADAARACA